MQKAQFLSRDKTLYRCKLLFNGRERELEGRKERNSQTEKESYDADDVYVIYYTT